MGNCILQRIVPWMKTGPRWSDNNFPDSFDNAHWRKATQWRKVKQMKMGPGGVFSTTHSSTTIQVIFWDIAFLPHTTSIRLKAWYALPSFNKCLNHTCLNIYTTFQNNEQMSRCWPNLENSKLLYRILMRRNSGLYSLDDSEMIGLHCFHRQSIAIIMPCIQYCFGSRQLLVW